MLKRTLGPNKIHSLLHCSLVFHFLTEERSRNENRHFHSLLFSAHYIFFPFFSSSQLPSHNQSHSLTIFFFGA